MRKIILFFFLMLTTVASAQDFKPIKGDCTPGLTDEAAARSGAPAPRRILSDVKTNWDPNKTYKQLVILVEFSDVSFLEGHDKDYYDNVFNKQGFHERSGKGCVADYFRDQSNGMFNLSCDVFGPYQVSQKAQPYSNPDENTRNYGATSLREATEKMINENPTHDFTQYDWDGNGSIEQVVYVFAGLPGNLGVASGYGHIWPNTSYFTAITTPDGKKISNYSSSGEHWPTTSNASCGIGTICHEYSHCLGLPDIYPTSSSAGYSVCDEWDLMDGGNFTNYGWCPPNYTALEKYLMGWLDLVDIEDAASMTDLQPVEDGGTAYRIKHSDSEWLILENRQQKGWDSGAPGKGLVIYHVNYDGSVWKGNSVNNDKSKRRFYLIPADNKDYEAWDKEIEEKGINPYANSNRMNNLYLSTSPYPYIQDDVVVNDKLTDDSTPAAKMFYPAGSYLGVPITNITMNAEGRIAFDVKGGTTAIKGVSVQKNGKRQLFDLSGRTVQATVPGQLYIVKEADGTVYKFMSK